MIRAVSGRAEISSVDIDPGHDGTY
jgi:hypothetical protein